VSRETPSSWLPAPGWSVSATWPASRSATTLPFERLDNWHHIEMFFEMMDGENQLLYSSDYPHQDFDLPTQIWDLPFLSEGAKRKILGENAMRLFGLTVPERGSREQSTSSAQ
jgi:amidohydrolase family protein